MALQIALKFLFSFANHMNFFALKKVGTPFDYRACNFSKKNEVKNEKEN